MIFDTPAGEVIDARSFPFVVMRDRLGIFVLADRIRWYCLELSAARKVAASFALAE